MINSTSIDEDDQAIAEFLSNYWRPVMKATLIGVMFLFAVEVLSQSLAKAITVSALSFAIALFNTWRRYLEPISLIAFLVAVIQLCDDSFLRGIAGTVLSVRS